MREIKPGDIVRRTYFVAVSYGPKQGLTYAVHEVDNRTGIVRLVGIPDSWQLDRFEFVSGPKPLREPTKDFKSYAIQRAALSGTLTTGQSPENQGG